MIQGKTDWETWWYCNSCDEIKFPCYGKYPNIGGLFPHLPITKFPKKLIKKLVRESQI